MQDPPPSIHQLCCVAHSGATQCAALRCAERCAVRLPPHVVRRDMQHCVLRVVRRDVLRLPVVRRHVLRCAVRHPPHLPPHLPLRHPLCCDFHHNHVLRLPPHPAHELRHELRDVLRVVRRDMWRHVLRDALRATQRRVLCGALRLRAVLCAAS